MPPIILAAATFFLEQMFTPLLERKCFISNVKWRKCSTPSSHPLTIVSVHQSIGLSIAPSSISSIHLSSHTFTGLLVHAPIHARVGPSIYKIPSTGFIYCLPIHQSTSSSSHPSAHSSIHWFIHPSISSFINSLVYPSIHQLIHQSTGLSIHPSVQSLIHWFIHPSISSFINSLFHPPTSSSYH